MADVRARFSIEDRMSSELEILKRALGGTQDMMLANAQEAAALIQKHIDLSDALETNTKSYNEGNTTSLRALQIVLDQEEAMDKLNEQIANFPIVMEKMSESTESTSNNLEKMAVSSQSTIKEIDDIIVATNNVIEAQEQYNHNIEQTTAVMEAQEPTANRRFAALERAQRQYELSGQRVELYKTKLQDLEASMQSNEEAINTLAAAQERMYSPDKERQLDALIRKQDQLNNQYQNMQITIQSAENAHVNAFDRMSQASMDMGVLTSALGQNINALPGPLRHVGRVGVQAMSAIEAGAKGAQLAIMAKTAAMTMGISVVIQGATTLYNRWREEQEEARRAEEATRKAREETEEFIRSSTRMSENAANMLRTMTSSARDMIESYERVKQSTYEQISAMEINAIHLQNAWREVETLNEKVNRNAQEQERMNYHLSVMEAILPGIRQYLMDENNELNIQIGIVNALVDSYYELAKAKAMGAAAEKMIGETYARQWEAERNLENIAMRGDRAAATAEVVRARQEYDAILGQARRFGGVETAFAGTAVHSTSELRAAEEALNNARKARDEIEATYRENIDVVNEMISQREGFEEKLFESLTQQFGLHRQFNEAGVTPLETAVTSAAIIEANRRLFDPFEEDPSRSVRENTARGPAIRTAEQNKLSFREEDLRMLHDIALRDIRLNYQQITPQVQFHLTVETLNETSDRDEIIEYFKSGILESVESVLYTPSQGGR